VSAPGTSQIRSLRPAKQPVAPDRALGHRWDFERGVRTERRRVLTVFLAGAECPFTCLFCDLWQHTLAGPTPVGALPHQLAGALAEADRETDGLGTDSAVKLYNASNFFDQRAVPPQDDDALALLCAPFSRVTVETHPRLMGDRAERFAAKLDGRLEVAMGLETIHPRVLPRLNKGMKLDDFERAVGWARARGIGVRAFVLVGLPWVPPSEFGLWAARTALYAGSVGVERVSLIPLRLGNGVLDDLAAKGDLGPVRLSHLEEALERSLAEADGDMIVDADLWDTSVLTTCDRCGPARTERLSAANLEQTIGAAVDCNCDA
jgi:radical SAM enzyme (TIGR01210 family)